MKKSKIYYDLFLKSGDPMCLVLSRDYERTENLRKQIKLQKKDDLTL